MLVSFTVATAITRLTGGARNLFSTSWGTLSAGQQLQRINEVLAAFYEEGTWRGVHTTVSLTTTSGIITLDEAYLRLDALQVTTEGELARIDIRDQQYEFQPNGPGIDPLRGFCHIAIDLGDHTNGRRRYRLTGASADADILTEVDALTFSGLARKRFVWITDTATVVTPDCYSALELGIRAMNAADEQANEVSKDLWAQAFAKLDAGLGEFEAGNELGCMQIDPLCAVESYNAV